MIVVGKAEVPYISSVQDSGRFFIHVCSKIEPNFRFVNVIAVV